MHTLGEITPTGTDSEPTANTDVSPIPSFILATLARLKISLVDMAERSGVSVDALRRMRDGKTEPQFRTVKRLVATVGDGTEATERVMGWAERRAAERAAAFRASRAAPRAICRGGCGREELVSRVRELATFRE